MYATRGLQIDRERGCVCVCVCVCVVCKKKGQKEESRRTCKIVTLICFDVAPHLCISFACVAIAYADSFYPFWGSMRKLE